MRIHQEQFEHPTQGSSVVLNVYEQQVPAGSPSADTGTRGRTGFLVTEDRIGSSRVVSTLGFYEDREQALQRLRDRAAQLLAQSWRATLTVA
jgi:hypothetical protein